MKLKLRPWRSGDQLAFDPRSDFAREMQANAWDWNKGAPGPTWTLTDGERVLGLGGGIAGGDGAWLAWAYLADLPARYWPEAVRCAGVAIDHLLKRPDVRWLWAQCRADFPAAERLLKRLGFSRHHVEPIAALGCDLVCMIREG